ncbi:HTH-type transcriptional regulator gltC [Providencia alcalifaciens]|nr:HTH-type transcriptional regulator gltC [Providencia alcalifaciens]
MPFNSENLMIFLTVLDKGSFSAAARALHRVPSAISMAIANLEAELGFSLFERHTRSLNPLNRPFLLPLTRVILLIIYAS